MCAAREASVPVCGAESADRRRNAERGSLPILCRARAPGITPPSGGGGEDAPLHAHAAFLRVAVPIVREELVAALGLSDAPGVVAIVGGGGKSSLMFALARALPGRVVMTTTTRIFAAQMQRAERVCSLRDAGWRRHLEDFEKGLLVVASRRAIPPGE